MIQALADRSNPDTHAAIEPTTPRISFGGKPPENPVSYDEYVLQLHGEGIPSAMEIHDMNSSGRGELIISEVAEDELRNS